MNQCQRSIAVVLRDTKPDPYAEPVSFKQWQRMAHKFIECTWRDYPFNDVEVVAAYEEWCKLAGVTAYE